MVLLESFLSFLPTFLDGLQILSSSGRREALELGHYQTLSDPSI